MKTIWVLGDQLNRTIGALAGAAPGEARVLLVESRRMITSRTYHRQRLHLVLTAMRRFAQELEKAGFEVDYQRSDSLSAGLSKHLRLYHPDQVVATQPNSRSVETLLRGLDVTLVRSNQFLCHRQEFADWAGSAQRLKLENFYRWQRRRLNLLMDGDQPAGGRWNFDRDNREPPPGDGRQWPEPMRSRLDDLDAQVVQGLPGNAIGGAPRGWWATSRRAALARLRHVIENVLPRFGPHEDAMLADNWHLAHTLLSPYLNLGLLLPGEVCERIEEAYRDGNVPINSAEGLIRQIIGWREFVWGLYWLWPEQAEANALGHGRAIPPAWLGQAETEMRCIDVTLNDLDARAYIHHIQRLMVLSNFANLYGVDPARVRDWMRARYIDGADWVMGPNVMGMGLWADGGRMATKPYVSGGAYIRRMSDYCEGCRFDARRRHGEKACPFTTLYWNFLDRHRAQLENNARMARQYGTLDRLDDLDALNARAASVVRSVRDGRM